MFCMFYMDKIKLRAEGHVAVLVDVVGVAVEAGVVVVAHGLAEVDEPLRVPEVLFAALARAVFAAGRKRGMWNCGIVEIWNRGIMQMVIHTLSFIFAYFHIFTIPQFHIFLDIFQLQPAGIRTTPVFGATMFASPGIGHTTPSMFSRKP